MSARTALSPGPASRLAVRGAPRLLRGWAAATVATVLAAGSHTLANVAASGDSHPAHGAGPAPILWILTLALAGPVCTALAGRRLSWWRLSAGVASSQLLFHWLYSATAAPNAVPTLTEAGLHAGHAPADGPEALAVTAAAGFEAASGGVQGAGAVTHSDSPAMAAAHLLAAVVTVVTLRRGEVLAARVAELAVGLVLRSPGARLARWVPAVPVRRVPSHQQEVAYRPLDVLQPALRLRGPPVRPALSLAA